MTRCISVSINSWRCQHCRLVNRKGKYLDEINIIEPIIIARSLDIQDRNDVLVVKVSQ